MNEASRLLLGKSIHVAAHEISSRVESSARLGDELSVLACDDRKISLPFARVQANLTGIRLEILE